MMSLGLAWQWAARGISAKTRHAPAEGALDDGCVCVCGRGGGVMPDAVTASFQGSAAEPWPQPAECLWLPPTCR